MPALSKSLLDAFNGQLRDEFASAYLYLSMSAHCEAQNFKGAAQWLKIQWEEEIGHALKLMHHVLSRGNPVTLLEIPKPASTFGSLLEVFQMALGHERQVSASISALYGRAIEEKDFAAQAFLQWFVSEQVEEEATASEIVEKFRMAGNESSMLLLLDRELGARGGGAEAESEDS